MHMSVASVMLYDKHGRLQKVYQELAVEGSGQQSELPTTTNMRT